MYFLAPPAAMRVANSAGVAGGGGERVQSRTMGLTWALKPSPQATVSVHRACAKVSTSASGHADGKFEAVAQLPRVAHVASRPREVKTPALYASSSSSPSFAIRSMLWRDGRSRQRWASAHGCWKGVQ